ncbi:conserved hypothetical protein [Halorhabdus utahensis DSM 12940]|uniref:Uncharacterized protein n=1 Tax=Halorhabdus utahensis (strain DSM 12940 / JCM 11049 / AX-2) TaxID=519442 RepID=C7NNF2_HALUD|nr:hypothetical protein [Halorhabdus utahensis]ACV11552.1 conserved hypothetical protein [Halorhabdus utahensis DSM 12940]
MRLIRGRAGGTALTGTLYEPGEESPSYEGAPDADAPFVWVCDAFYAVESGGTVQHVDGKDINVAFESPAPRGFADRDRAIAAAEEHVRTQFGRLGLAESAVEIEHETVVSEHSTADQ